MSDEKDFYTIPTNIYDKIVENQDNGMSYYNACWDAYGGNLNDPLSPQDGARLYFIYALANVCASLNGGERIETEKSVKLFKRIAAHKGEPSLFDNAPETSPIVQNAMAADYALSYMANTIVTNLAVYNSALLGLLTFVSFASTMGDNVKKSAKLDYSAAAGNVIQLCETARTAHQFVTMGMSILRAVSDVAGVSSNLLFGDLGENGIIVNGLFNELSILYQVNNTTKETRDLLKKIAADLNTFNTAFIFNYELYSKIREDLKENDFSFTRYLGNGFIGVELNKYKDYIDSIYRNRADCEAYQEFLEEIQDIE